MSLNAKAWMGGIFLALGLGLLIFAPAGTLRYWQGWLFFAVFFGTSALTTVYLMRHDRALLQRRLVGGPFAEKEPVQRVIMLLAAIGFVALLVVPSLGHRFGIWPASMPAIIAGNALVAVGFFIAFLVFRENTFAASTVEVGPDHHVITTGPYAIVRHPMYAGAFLYLLGMPLALGSYLGLPVLAAMAAVLLWRLFDEEDLLTRNLPGYAAYRGKVRWRLIPGIF